MSQVFLPCVAGPLAAAGLGEVPPPIFFAPLQTSLVPSAAGNFSVTFVRATTAFVEDNEGMLKLAASGEARFHGARRVRNLITASQNFAWGASGVTSTFGATGPTGLPDANTITATGANGSFFTNVGSQVGLTANNSLWIRRRTGTGAIFLRNVNNVNIDITGQLDGTWKRFGTPPLVVTATGQLAVQIAVIGDAVDITYAQFELVDGAANQAPSEYVSNGVLSAPFHGAGVSSVKYFGTTNGNTVVDNVVVEAAGTAIPDATLLGYLAETTVTNLCLRSQEFDNATSWTPTSATITPNTQTAPDGTLTADTFTDDATNVNHRVLQAAISFTASTPYTFSVYAKAGTLTWVQLNLLNVSTARWANFNLATGVIGNKEAGTTATITALPNGWYRCSVSAAADGTASGNVRISSLPSDINASNPAYVGTGQTMHLWGAQVNALIFLASYVPTTTVAVVKNADDLRYPVLTNIDGAVGTTYAESYFASIASAANRIVLNWVDPNVYPQSYPISNVFNFRSPAGIVGTVNTMLVGANKGASAWSGATASACLNGGAVGTGVFTAYPNTGNISVGVTSQSINGFVRNVKFYATRLTDVQLQGLTA